MNIIKTPLITTIALALVAATPAAAHTTTTTLPTPGNAKYAVAAGKIEHSVTVTEVSRHQGQSRATCVMSCG